ncbi:hypothetical protein A3G67_03225 [Candidatus Roizmanbacteria bacterium RIFCSPLOWO2_12_FULL_40_12]|uniref:Polysaccharide biosynthesis protein C-terminal domain-containing protein n=1 Tax=Candidatus Roizmanbacteria bacterium RIFCSPLOWO2_01_FULL_40_42 TaxID=1802066 RepID=A0A1F7J5F9_9BACT|nr:MAG: hypothetical protein A2779_02860 [Candidatus Roizmanbacteria bacterium RIFCSPHIGHO2_01_FULL_40_98]OGK28282.1 MAG: hypothetical protein A3C31_00225 [Candidatus Roizmanbacteria bacterium RIFCSPHIGHO2_02_FULL_40_53]OGK30518.1 MAG: hypothetical protein A2W49_02910 [Candidatus Roizmanbacteria bacterium RIFCSPHIGHO2_12_41_18]OGK36932.1 MAG: hypothetical protein A3E69_00485 [Candidatus Roizmanbacteria bacterium RIFCSPHIGHO2_12_FULL_40_130]OGK50838.1 MAG: hypothetical protein A3B50_00995 [Candi
MKKTLSKYWKNEFVQGGFVFTVFSFISSFLNYLFNFFAARALGPAGFGEITALFSYITIFSVPTIVMTLVVIQKVGSKGHESERFALSLQTWFFALVKRWWFLIILSLILSPIIPRVTNLSPISSYTLIPLAILTFIGAFYGAIFQGLRLFLSFSLISITAIVLKLLGPIFVLVGVDGLLTMVVFLVISGVAGILLLHTFMKKYVVSSISPKKTAIQKRLKDALFNKQVIVTFFSVLAITSFNNLDVIFVKKFFSAGSTGIYGSWSLMAKIITYVVGPAVTVSYIFFSGKRRHEGSEKVLLLSLGALFLVALGSFIAYKYFPTLLIQMFFGKRFLSVSPYLPQASIFGSLYSVITFINSYFLAKKSNFSLLLPLTIPIYATLLFLIPKEISSIMTLNIYFSLCVACLYLIAASSRFLYNMPQWK